MLTKNYSVELREKATFVLETLFWLMKANSLIINLFWKAMHPGWLKNYMSGERVPVTKEERVKSITNTLFTLQESHNGAFIGPVGKETGW